MIPIILSLVVYNVPINCQGPFGCPDWAWEEHMECIQSHKEDFENRWIHVSEAYPNGLGDVLVWHHGLIKQAIYQTRCRVWIFSDLSGYANLDDVVWWRLLPNVPSNEYKL